MKQVNLLSKVAELSYGKQAGCKVGDGRSISSSCCAMSQQGLVVTKISTVSLEGSKYSSPWSWWFLNTLYIWKITVDNCVDGNLGL